MEQTGDGTVRVWFVQQEIFLLFWPVHLSSQVRPECGWFYLRSGLQEILQNSDQHHHCTQRLPLRPHVWLHYFLSYLASHSLKEGLTNSFPDLKSDLIFVDFFSQDNFPARCRVEKVCGVILWRDPGIHHTRPQNSLCWGENPHWYPQHQPQWSISSEGQFVWLSAMFYWGSDFMRW